jgi:hypothetical protein
MLFWTQLSRRTNHASSYSPCLPYWRPSILSARTSRHSSRPPPSRSPTVACSCTLAHAASAGPLSSVACQRRSRKPECTHEMQSALCWASSDTQSQSGVPRVCAVPCAWCRAVAGGCGSHSSLRNRKARGPKRKSKRRRPHRCAGDPRSRNAGSLADARVTLTYRILKKRKRRKPEGISH